MVEVQISCFQTCSVLVCDWKSRHVQRSFKLEPDKLYKIRNMKQPVITLFYVTRWSPLATMCGHTKPSGGRSWNYQLLKIAAPLESCTKQEMRSVIWFLSADGAKPVEINTRMLAKCGASCMSKTQVYEWVQKFKNRVQNVAESPQDRHIVS
jgi:hypothetical protein